MMPIISIIGRNNVGKSTLFNELTKTKDSLVTDVPGTTIDRKYGYLNIGNQTCILIDTAGFSDQISNSLLIQDKLIYQTNIAIKKSDIIIFLVNAREGILPKDYFIAQRIRKIKKNVVVVVNKIDGLDKTAILESDFYDLGFKKIYYISALNKIGINFLINRYFVQFIKLNNFSNNYCQKDNQFLFISDKNSNYDNYLIKNYKALKIIVLGKPNVGKSTLINSLIREERVITHHDAGTTRDIVLIPMEDRKIKFVLIDTAGITKNKNKNKNKNTLIESKSITRTISFINKSNIVLFVINVVDQITRQDLSLLSLVIRSGKSLIILMNKWDLIPISKRKLVKEHTYNRLKFLRYFTIHYVSALHSFNLKKILPMANQIYQSAITKLSSSKLTKIMNTAVIEHSPPLHNGHKIKFKYAHSGGYDPLIIVFHGSKLNLLMNSYKKYLENYFKRSLNLINTPIQLNFKNKKKFFLRSNSK